MMDGMGDANPAAELAQKTESSIVTGLHPKQKLAAIRPGKK
jgi:hypothetical protein